MSNLGSKRAQAPEPIKNIDLKPSAEDQNPPSEMNVTNVETPVIEEKADLAPEKDAKSITENASNEEAKIEENSNQAKETNKESPAVEKKQVEEAEDKSDDKKIE